MPNKAVVGDGGGCSGVEGWSQFAVGLDGTTSDCGDDAFDVTFNSDGRRSLTNDAGLAETAVNEKHIIKLINQNVSH